jgi:hypothetical protein
MADVKTSVTGFLDKCRTKYPILKKTIEHPFYTSCIIVLVIMLIVAVIFRDVDVGDTSLGKRCLRAGIYSLVVTTAIVFMHNKCLMSESKTGGFNEEVHELFDGGAVDITGGEHNININPNVSPDYQPVGMGAALMPVNITSFTGNQINKSKKINQS